MVEKIPQHRHCATCGRAHAGEGRFCSDACQTSHDDMMRRKKYQLYMLYGLAIVVLLVVLYTGL